MTPQKRIGVIISLLTVPVLIFNLARLIEGEKPAEDRVLGVVVSLITLALFVVSALVESRWLKVAQVTVMVTVACLSLKLASSPFFGLAALTTVIMVLYRYGILRRRNVRFKLVVTVVAIFTVCLIAAASPQQAALWTFYIMAFCAITYFILKDELEKQQELNHKVMKENEEILKVDREIMAKLEQHAKEKR